MFIIGWRRVYRLAIQIAERLGVPKGRHEAVYFSAVISIRYESISGEINIRNRVGDVVFQTSAWPSGQKAICFRHGSWELEMRRLARILNIKMIRLR